MLQTQHVQMLTDGFPLKPFSPFAVGLVWRSQVPQTPACPRLKFTIIYFLLLTSYWKAVCIPSLLSGKDPQICAVFSMPTASAVHSYRHDLSLAGHLNCYSPTSDSSFIWLSYTCPRSQIWWLHFLIKDDSWPDLSRMPGYHPREPKTFKMRQKDL